MSFIASPTTTTISTWAPPRRAPRPTIVPLFATTVRLRCRPGRPVIHTDLPLKPVYHPYPQNKRFATSSAPQAAAAASPLPSLEEPPGSPLTPISDAPHALSQPMLVPPPPGTLSVTSLKLSDQLVKDYRATAKRAITALGLDVQRSLKDQDPKARDAARAQIESRIPHYVDHEDHWGADILLRDQLKSIRDSDNKKKKKKNLSTDD